MDMSLRRMNISRQRRLLRVPSSRSHFASVVRGLAFLLALIVPMVALGSVGKFNERARHLRCVERATASAAAEAVSLGACFGDD